MGNLITKPFPGATLNPLHPIARGLVGCWLMNEGTGSQIFDIMGFKHGFLTNFAPGDWIDFGLKGNGVNSYISTITDQDVKGSVLCWYKPKTVSNMSILGHAENPGSGTFDRALSINSASKAEAYIYDGAEKRAVSTTTLITNMWYMLGFIFDGSNLKIYVNGINEATVAAGNPFTGYITPEFIIGHSPDKGNQYSDGIFKQVYRYNRPLSDFETKSLYENPYQIFNKFDISRYYVSVSGIVIPVIMHHYRQQKMA